MIDDFVCGFCENSSKDCSGCRIAIMRNDLEELAAKAQWEHRLRYASDRDSTIRCCEYCKHLFIDIPTYKLQLTTNQNIWCALDGSDKPVKDKHRGCDKWERMPFNGFA